MSGFFALDTETLGTEEKSVILSVAICYIDLDTVSKLSPIQIIEYVRKKSLFVKLDAKEQLDMGRVSNKSTLDWWKEQNQTAKVKSLLPSAEDIKAADAINQIKEYIKKYNGKTKHIFERGSMDEFVLKSLCKMLGAADITNFGNWRDFRTAIDVLYGSSFGYCAVEGVNMETDICKHDPVDDIAFDVAMMLAGFEE